jgi:hypothetical protein
MSNVNTAKLKKGQTVTINIPFTYTVGDVGYHSGKNLNSIEALKNEVRAEIAAGVLTEDEVFLEVGKIE